MQIALSESVLARVRFRIREFLPDLPASRVSEALAAALGHRTNAALVAHVRDADRSVVLLAAVDPPAFGARLAEMGVPVPDGAGDAVSRAVVAAGAAADGDSYEEVQEAAIVAYNSSSPGQSWSFMSNVERFAYMSFLLTWRMGHTAIGIVDFMNHYADPDGIDIVPRLAAAYALHADADPEIAAFLVEFLGQASLSPRRDGGAEGDDEDDGSEDHQARLRWGDHVFWAFEPRIRTFRDAACRRWDASVNPLALEMSWPVVRRGAMPRRWGTPRYPTLAINMTPMGKTCPLTPRDTGWNGIRESAIGMTCFALWRHGAPYRVMSEFARSAETAGTGLPDLVSRWIDLDGTRGSPASLIALRDILFPKHPLHGLLRMDQLGFKQVTVVLLRDQNDVDVVWAAFSNAGWTNLMSVGRSFPPIGGGDPPAYVIPGLREECSHSPETIAKRAENWDMAMAALMRSNPDAIHVDGTYGISGYLQMLRSAVYTGQFLILSSLSPSDKVAFLDMANEARSGGSSGYPYVIDASDRLLVAPRP